MSDFTEKNRQYFEKMATTYKTDFGKALEILYRTAQGRRHWASDIWNDTEAGKGKEIKMLEYACGPGVVSQALAPYVTKVVGLDISDAMIDEYTNNARQAGLSDKIVGYKGDLLADTASTEMSGPEFFDFDVVFISMALHHFEKPELAMKRFAERMKKGGVCLIIDLFVDEDQGHHHGHGHGHDHDHGHGHGHDHGHQHEFAEANETISRHGFAKDDMRKLYESAGLGKGFDYQVVEEPLVFEKDGRSFSKTVFIARGQLG